MFSSLAYMRRECVFTADFRILCWICFCCFFKSLCWYWYSNDRVAGPKGLGNADLLLWGFRHLRTALGNSTAVTDIRDKADIFGRMLLSVYIIWDLTYLCRKHQNQILKMIADMWWLWNVCFLYVIYLFYFINFFLLATLSCIIFFRLICFHCLVAFLSVLISITLLVSKQKSSALTVGDHRCWQKVGVCCIQFD